MVYPNLIEQAIAFQASAIRYLHTVSLVRGTNGMYFYTTRLLVFLAVTGGLAAAIVLSLSGELIAHVFG